MIALELAAQLKEAGLEWQPALHDFFLRPLPRPGSSRFCPE